jgi:hypothetical protein
MNRSVGYIQTEWFCEPFCRGTASRLVTDRVP